MRPNQSIHRTPRKLGSLIANVDREDERQRQIDSGEARFTDWETAKKRIRDQAS